MNIINGKSSLLAVFSEAWSNAHSQIAFGETYIHAVRQVSQAAVIMGNLL